MITTRTRSELLEGANVANPSSKEVSPIAVESMMYVLLQQVSEDLEKMQGQKASAQTTTSAASSSETEAGDSLYKDLRTALFDMVGILEDNKIKVSEFHAKKSENSTIIDSYQSKLLSDNYDELLLEMEEMARKEESRSIAMKIAGAFAMIGGAVLALFTGGASVAAVMLVIGALSTIPCSNGKSVLANLSSSISTAIVNASAAKAAPGEEPRISPELAQFIANLIVTVAVTISTLGTSALANAGAKAASKATSNIMQNISKGMGEVNLAKTTISTGIAVSGYTGTLSSMVMAMPGDEDKKEMAAMIIGIAEQVAAIFATCYTASSGGKLAARGSSDLAEGIAESATEFLTKTIHNVAATTVHATAGSAALTNGIIGISIADTKRNIAELNSFMLILNYTIDANNAGMREDAEKRKSLVNEQAAMTEKYFDLSGAGEELARAMRA